MTKRTPAEAFPPGEILRDELDERGWTQADLATILGRNERDVNDIINAKRQVTPRTAKELAEALGTSAELWLNLQSAYDLWSTDLEEAEGTVARRARLFSKVPVNKLLKRGWIEASENIDVLEQRVLDFLGIDELDSTPQIWRHAARKASRYDAVSPHQWAWLCRARQLATALEAQRHTKARFSDALNSLHACLAEPEEIRRVPGILAEGGVRVVVVEPLPGTKIDGATFWIDADSPVIAVSLRYNRIDWWWFTLAHELGHVAHRHGLGGDELPLDIDLAEDLDNEDRPDYEREADRFAESFLVDQDSLANFIARVRPLYSRKRIRAFAKSHGVHPGIVVGQLQHRKEISYAHSRNLLMKVQDIVTSSALTDGWGHQPPVPA